MVQVQFCELHKISPGEVQPGANNTKTNGLALSVNAGTSSTLTFDANGNMTSDGTNSYAWDAANRLIEIVYPGTGNNSQFAYDGLGRNVQILEYTASSLTSTKQFVWANGFRWEARNAASTVTAQYFTGGEIISGTSYILTGDHLGSIREMTSLSGVIQAQYAYDPFGRVSKMQGSLSSDFQYGNYCYHSASGLNLTRTRAYTSGMARFITRDPIEERGGSNLYEYVSNEPTNFADPSGLDKCCHGGGGGGVNANEVFQAMLKGAAAGFGSGAAFGEAFGGVGGLVTTGPGAVVTTPLGGLGGGLLGAGLGGLAGAGGNLAGQLNQMNGGDNVIIGPWPGSGTTVSIGPWPGSNGRPDTRSNAEKLKDCVKGCHERFGLTGSNSKFEDKCIADCYCDFGHK